MKIWKPREGSRELGGHSLILSLVGGHVRKEENGGRWGRSPAAAQNGGKRSREHVEALEEGGGGLAAAHEEPGRGVGAEGAMNWERVQTELGSECMQQTDL